jgi:hypothetical protein
MKTVVDYTAKDEYIKVSRQAKNQRQLAESVRNMLRNMLKEGVPYTGRDLHEIRRNLEEMSGDMEQLNVLRITETGVRVYK